MSDEPKMNIVENVMSAIVKGKAKMKPRWYFVAGLFAIVSGLVGIAILSIFLVSVVSFSLRTHGPMGAIRYEQLLASFPWWAVIVAAIGIGFGIKLLKQYDFSYKKNFPILIGSIILAILVAGWLVDVTGLDSIWMKRGPMKEFYRKYDGGMKRGYNWQNFEK